MPDEESTKPEAQAAAGKPDKPAKPELLHVCVQSQQTIGNVSYPIGREIGVVELSPGVTPADFTRLIQAGVAS